MSNDSIQSADLSPGNFPLAEVAGWFRAFYAVAPWGERWRCNECSPPDDFGAAGRYSGESIVQCPVCGASLEPYWSDQRVLKYFTDAALNPGFLGQSLSRESALIGWTWGYDASAVAELADLPPGTFYVDIIGVRPEYRARFVRRVFEEGHARIRRGGFTSAVARTRRDARHVHFALLSQGYTHYRASADGEREYWLRSLLD